MPYRWLVLTSLADTPDHYCHTQEECFAYVREVLLPEADKWSENHDGEYPTWLDEVLICEIKFDLVQSENGTDIRDITKLKKSAH